MRFEPKHAADDVRLFTFRPGRARRATRRDRVSEEGLRTERRRRRRTDRDAGRCGGSSLETIRTFERKMLFSPWSAGDNNDRYDGVCGGFIAPGGSRRRLSSGRVCAFDFRTDGRDRGPESAAPFDYSACPCTCRGTRAAPTAHSGLEHDFRRTKVRF